MSSAHLSEDVRIFHKECVSLAKEGYDTYYVVRGNTYEKNGVHIVGIGDVPNSRIKRMLHVSKQIYKRALHLNADVYHFHDPELLPYGLKLKRKGKVVIFDSHEYTLGQINEKTWIPNLIRAPLYIFFDRYLRYICKRIDAVIPASKHTDVYFKKLPVRTQVVTNFPKYIDISSACTDKMRLLCFAGGLSEQWNHEKIINAIESIDDVGYILCGRADDGYIDKLKNLEGWSKVDYRGLIPYEEVANLLSSCSVGVSILQPGYNTGWHFGNQGNTKIYEQMMAGLPVVCTDFDIWKDMINKYHCGICVNPDSIDEIRAAIQYLLDHPEEAHQMGENGRRAIKEEFNWSVEEKKLLALYKDLLKPAEDTKQWEKEIL